MTPTSSIASWVANVSLAAIPAEAIEHAKVAILDTLGVVLAGAREPAARIAASVVREEGARPVASLLGDSARVSMEGAAFVNGIAAHVLDYDDVSWEILGHPSAVVLPAALAAGEASNVSGERLLEAYVVGVEVMAKFARAMGPDQYERGWHTTATAGTIGAAMAASKILGLGETATQNAIGISVSEAAGTRQNFGSMAKAFQVGHAARSGVSAARLAARGMTGNGAILEGPLGYFALFAHRPDAAAEVAAMLSGPLELVSPGISLKKFPCCYGMHRALQGTLDLMRSHALTADDVSSVSVVAPAGELVPLVDDLPRNGLEGKFSMRYGVASAILDGEVRRGTFSDQMVRRGAAIELMKRIEVQPRYDRTTRGGGEGYVTVRLTTSAGLDHEARIVAPPGSPGAPMTRHELVAKFADCASDLGRGGVDEVVRAVDALDLLPQISDLVASLVSQAEPAGE